MVRLYLVLYCRNGCESCPIDSLYLSVLYTVLGVIAAHLLCHPTYLDRNGVHLAFSIIVQALETCRLSGLRSASSRLSLRFSSSSRPI